MDDSELDQLLDAAAKEWRVTTTFPADAIWERVAAEGITPLRQRHSPGWGVFGLATAAALLLGVALGRHSSAPLAVVPGAVVATAPAPLLSPADEAYSDATKELLGKTALLLASLPEANIPSTSTVGIAQQGGELLTTTRILLDSPSANDPQMRSLLEDLELVLAQVARLHASAGPDLGLIHDALDRHEIVPRLRSAVTGETLDLNEE